MSLIVLGTVAIDNLSTPVGEKKGLLGGSGTHFAMSASIFTNLHLVSVVGKDFPDKHMTFLKNKGVDVSSILEREGKTFEWTGEYKKEDLNTAITHETELGVLADYTPQVAHNQRTLPNVFLANFDPDVQLAFLKLMKNPKFVGMDTMNLWIDIKQSSVKKLMKKVNLFIANDGEARELSGEGNLIKAAKKLRKMGPSIVVVKKGEHGVLVYTDQYAFSFPAYPVEKVVDPTGAGDTFAGGLMGYLSRCKKIDEKALRKAATYATTLASFNVQGFAMAKTAPLTKDDVEARRKELLQFIKP